MNCGNLHLYNFELPQLLLRWVGFGSFLTDSSIICFPTYFNTIFLFNKINLPISIKCTLNIEVVYKYM